jgi:hypothetical protein
VNKLDPNGNWAFAIGLIEAGLAFLGLGAAAEITSDIARDGELNGNGAIASTIASLGSLASPFAADEVQGRSRQGPTLSAREISFAAGQALGVLTTGPQYEAAKGAIVRADPVRGQALLDRYLGTAFTGLGTHANSLQSPNENQLYHLRERLPGGGLGEITKIGITSDLRGGRYSENELAAMNSRFIEREMYPNRLAARAAEVSQTLEFVREHGRFPTYTFRW